ncbi:MAG: DUF3299 domain-containing protein [Burkholderiaceae bacterium]|nr:DUF3299 domain-containing protein [Burkholderiaceae bacterium]
MAALAPAGGAAQASRPVEIAWEALIPKDWDPSKRFRGRDVSNLDDSDPRSAELLRELREEWDNAPTVAALNGRAVRLPGYLVPLESQGGALQEFLLVPYFGACIHSPPPPANQIVHVRAARPVKGLRSMDAVWVAGVLRTERRDSGEMGVSGYRLDAQSVQKYVAPAR